MAAMPAAAPAAAGPKPAAEKKPRTLSPYNYYMRAHVSRIKAEQPTLPHKDAFRLVAAMWATAPENPKSAVNAMAANQ
eukprot:contig_18840_g4632